MYTIISEFIKLVFSKTKLTSFQLASFISNAVGLASLIRLGISHQVTWKSILIPITTFFLNFILILGSTFNMETDAEELIKIFEQSDFSTQVNEIDLDLQIEDVDKEKFKHLFNSTSKQQAKYFYKIDRLDRYCSLPVVTYEELNNIHGPRFENKWILSFYPIKFLSMWWGVDEEKVIHLKRTLQACNFNNLAPESNSEMHVWLGEFLSRAIGVIFSFLVSRACNEKFSLRNISTGYTMGKDFSSLYSSFQEALTKFYSKDKTQENIVLETINKYVEELNIFLETPAHTLASNYLLLHRYKEMIIKLGDILKTFDKTNSSIYSLASGIYQAASIRKNEIYSSELPKYSRQEPFIVLIRGDGGIGKTFLSKYLAKFINSEILQSDDISRDYIEITSNDKYWPPIGAQRIALFDEAGTVKNFENDLLFSNLKGICSPAFFNCAGADISHKVTPCNFQVILATTNTNFDDISSRIANISSPESVYPYYRRMIVINAEWNGTYDYNNGNAYSSNFSHLKLSKMSWNQNLQRMANVEPITLHALKELIRNTYMRKARDLQLVNNLHSLQKQNYVPQTKIHYSVVLHGPGGAGKTITINQIATKLSQSTNFPIIRINNENEMLNLPKQSEKCILVCDDTFKCHQQVSLEECFMDVYNNKLINNSIILTATNLKLKYNAIQLSLKNFSVNYQHPFINIGMARRIGFVRRFKDTVTPNYNTDIYFKNGHAMEQGDIILSYFKLIILLIFFSLFNYYFSYISFLILLCIPFLIEYNINVISDPCEHIYTKYLNFLSFRKSFKIVNGNPPNFKPTFIFEAISPSVIKHTGGIMELESHIYINESWYRNSKAPWKFLLDKDVANKLQVNYEKFTFAISDINSQNIISIMERYAKIMQEFGISPAMKVHINEIGTFYLYENIIYTNYSSTSQTVNFLSIVNNNIVGENINIPFQIPLTTTDYSEIYKLNLTQSILVNNFIKSKEYLNHPLVKRFLYENLKREISSKIAINVKNISEKVSEFFSSTRGKFTIALLTLLGGSYLAYKTYSYFFSNTQLKPERKLGHKKVFKNNPKVDTSEEEDNVQHEKKLGYKKIFKKNPKIDTSEEEDNIQHEKKLGYKKIFKPNPKNDSSEDEEHIFNKQMKPVQKEDIKNLCDMNDFSSYLPSLEVVHRRARKNLAQVYIVHSSENILYKEPTGLQSCYSLFIGNKHFVTVGHILQTLKNNSQYNLYIGSDEFEGFHKCHLLSSYDVRDLSIWNVPTLVNQFPDITQHFASRKLFSTTLDYNAALERFSPGKISHWAQGNMMYWSQVYDTNEGKISEFGYVDFCTFGLKLTSNGDCGLPYYFIDNGKLAHKIIGLHCMGNVEGTESVGILSCIFYEDVKAWISMDRNIPHMLVSQNDTCTFCGSESIIIAPSHNPFVPGHEIAWHSFHEATPATFYEELKHYLQFRPNFSGQIIRNTGPIAYGSVHHSHTQFIPGDFNRPIVTNGWQQTTLEELEINHPRFPTNLNISRRVIDGDFRTIFSCLDNITLGEDWRIHIFIYTHKSKRKATIDIRRFHTVKIESQFIQQGMLPLTTPSKAVVYVPQDVKDIFDRSTKNLNKGRLPDIPFERVEDNQTVTVIGTLNQSASRLPRNKYHKTPFSTQVSELFPIEKAPVRLDTENAPPEILSSIERDRLNRPNMLLTQSIQWAHKEISPDPKFRAYIRDQFMSKILQHYSNLTLLTPQQILEGFPSTHSLYGGLGPLELDKSIGFTMKQLYHVQRKGDVLSKDEFGHYTWKDNEASHFAQNFFEESKKIVADGGNHYSAFLELVKMEKLKLAKIWTGRTFVAEDLNGVLFERYAMGCFSARAMLHDPTCGVGTNAYDDFHKIYMRLTKFQNIFTGDYKRYDRTTPYCIFEDNCTMLCEANPKIANEIRSVFNALQHRIQISGTTVFECRGGMPSGCAITAPLNSLNNDLIIYSCFASIMKRNNLDTTYQAYDRNVVRSFYGDDVILSVSDEVKDCFDLVSLAEEIKSLFGMTMDSSAKDGSLKRFETFEEASWISRFFRKLDNKNFFVGALKKISIVAHLHYTTDLSPNHLGSIFTTMQFEAALWDQEFFNKIQEAIRIAVKIQPKILNYFSFRTRKSLQEELYFSAIPKYLKWNFNEIPNDLCEQNKTFFEKYYFKRSYQRHVISCPSDFSPNTKNIVYGKVHYRTMLSYTSRLHEIFQLGIISKPIVNYSCNNQLSWNCDISITTNNQIYNQVGLGKSKKEAREEAAYLLLQIVDKNFVILHPKSN